MARRKKGHLNVLEFTHGESSCVPPTDQLVNNPLLAPKSCTKRSHLASGSKCIETTSVDDGETSLSLDSDLETGGQYCITRFFWSLVSLLVKFAANITSRSFAEDCNSVGTGFLTANQDWTEISAQVSNEENTDELFLEFKQKVRTLDSSEVKVGRKKLAEGAQGIIYEAWLYDPNSHEPWLPAVAKKLKSFAGVSHGHYPHELHGQTFNNFVCAPFGYLIESKDSIYLIMRRCKDGDLRGFIDKNGKPSPILALDVIIQIALGMEVLHQHGIIHGDIKASNIFVIKSGPMFMTIQIGDFELSSSVLGTGFWRAPEVLQGLENTEGKRYISFKSDVYSFGMTCYEILTGLTPFGERRATDYEYVISGNRPKLPEEVPECLQKLINDCWQAEPAARPTFADIVQTLRGMADHQFLGCEYFPMAQNRFQLMDMDTKLQSESPDAMLRELRKLTAKWKGICKSYEWGGTGPHQDLFEHYSQFHGNVSLFVWDFGWDSFEGDKLLPFSKFVKRRQLVILMDHILSKIYTFKQDDIAGYLYGFLGEPIADWARMYALAFAIRKSVGFANIGQSISKSYISEDDYFSPGDHHWCLLSFVDALLGAGLHRLDILFEVSVILGFPSNSLIFDDEFIATMNVYIHASTSRAVLMKSLKKGSSILIVLLVLYYTVWYFPRLRKPLVLYGVYRNCLWEDNINVDILLLCTSWYYSCWFKAVLLCVGFLRGCKMFGGTFLNYGAKRLVRS